MASPVIPNTYYIPFRKVMINGHKVLIPCDEESFAQTVEGQTVRGRIDVSRIFNPALMMPADLSRAIFDKNERETVEILTKIGYSTEFAASFFNYQTKRLPYHGVFGY